MEQGVCVWSMTTAARHGVVGERIDGEDGVEIFDCVFQYLRATHMFKLLLNWVRADVGG